MKSEAKKKPVKRKRRWLRRIVITIAVIILLGVFTSWYIDYRGEARPPVLSETPTILSEQVSDANGVRKIGNSWMAEKNGLLYMYLEGDPFTLGYTNSMLSDKYINEQEASLMALIKKHLPSWWQLWLIRKIVTWRNRDLSKFVPLELQIEVFGLSKGYKDPYPELGHLYHRLLNYHAAHDISHAVMDNPLMGCTASAAWGSQTEDGHLLLGRNFDFQAGECFDKNKIVVRVCPEKGIGFISVVWPGMAGAVSGINDERIAVTINAGHSEDSRTIGTPVSMVVRKVLQYAHTLEEAIEIIRKSTVFVADSFLIADGKTGRAVVVEKTPLRSALREPEGDYIVLANHFMTKELKDDPKNVAYKADGTTVVRHARMEKLLLEASGKITPKKMATILRDRNVPNLDQPVMGNPAAVNSLVATHSVIIDATAGVIWVSNFPHQLGKYTAFSLKAFDKPGTIPSIAADPLITDGRYEKYCKFLELIAEAESLADDDDFDQAKAKYTEAMELVPSNYQAPMELGTIAFETDDYVQANILLLKAKSLYPAYKSERDTIDSMLQELQPEMSDTKR